MGQSVTVQLELPSDFKRFHMPPALHARLHELLDRQSRTGRLKISERKEAEALVELSEMLTLLKIRAKKSQL
ncbi:MAG TPA: hypothetical protein VEK08_13755 [Planctomycetota bacterium]|nr:hypothetical protein [Planctomycetota bacterium]